MRDFNNNGGNINAGNNVYIGDGTKVENQLLIHCTSEVLLEERPFRKENIQLEQKKKAKRVLPFLGLAVLMFLGSAVWAQLNDKTDLVSFIFGAGSLFLGFMSIKATFEPNAFQLQEQAAVDEINMILKSRRVE